MSVCLLASCADMLNTKSSRLVTDPNLNDKTDSVFYAYGIMQAMQQLADQYYFQNEMRGDLVAPTSNATTHLKNLADFSAGTENKYDSVYVYYKVINNCNYYLQKRDTTLLSGTKNVTINEFVGIVAFRAWAYLQLAKQYGDVPYVTSPVMSVSEINATTERTPYMTILQSQADYLQDLKNRYSDEFLSVPYYQASVSIGHLNYSNSRTKTMIPSKCFLPINVVLGDIYLEMGEYKRAAEAYHDYLLSQSKTNISKISNNKCNFLFNHDQGGIDLPLDFNYIENEKYLTYTIDAWDAIFSYDLRSGQPNENEVISYIPMAVNYTMGQTTNVPQAFGYDYYASTNNRVSRYHIFECPESNEMQVQPSTDYLSMLHSAPFYYISNEKDPSVVTTRYIFKSANLGDGRSNMIAKGMNADSTKLYVQKPATGFIYLYRNTTVYLRLAEALNRMGEPELAFAVLKSGIHTGLKSYVDTAYVEENKIPQENYYIPYNSYKKLTEGNLAFLSAANAPYFENTARKEIVGIHFHGAGAVEDLRSTYTYKTVVEARIDKIREKFSVAKQGQYDKAEYINAVEDLLCDEYAFEFAFEGTRFSDLQRIARHKNADTTYGANFGSIWFADKLKKNNPTKSLLDPNNWYLPFK